MPLNGVPESVRQFIFEHIDSVEQLDVLLLLHAHPTETYDALRISAELRSSPTSVMNRLLSLEQRGFLLRVDPLNETRAEADETLPFRFNSQHVDSLETIDALAEHYRQKRQRIFEIIFSPLKKGRMFAEAFVVTTPKKGKDNG